MSFYDFFCHTIGDHRNAIATVKEEIMTSPNQTSNQPEDNNNPSETNAIQVSERNNTLVEENMPYAEERVKQETKQLIEAITRKAQLETQKVGEFAQDNYLEAIRNVRGEIEKLNFDPERVEEAIKLTQMDAEKNWESLVKEVEDFGNRLNEAAQAAWAILTGSTSHSDDSSQSKS